MRIHLHLNLIFILVVTLGFTRAFAKSRIYTADEISNTVSVIDPEKNVVLGVINLGYPRPHSFSAFPVVNSQINVHGIDYSPQKRLLAVTSNITNSVALLNLDGNQEPKFIPVGRAPHTSNFSPDGTELWVNVRGEQHISVIDIKSGTIKKSFQTEKAPSFTNFLKRKPIAIVSSGWSKNLVVYDQKLKTKIKTVPLKGSLSVVAQLNTDESELWVVQKDIDSVARINTETFEVLEYIKTGPYTQHVGFLKQDGTEFAFVTVGGDDKVKIFQVRDGKAVEVQSLVTPGVPHGVIADNRTEQLYVANEVGDTMEVFSTRNFKHIKTLQIGASPQAIILVQDLDAEKLERFEKKWLKPMPFGAIISSMQAKSTDAESGRSGAIGVRRFSHVDFFIFQLFGMSGDKGIYNVYLMNDHEQDLAKSELVGMIRCFGILTCIDYASFPADQARIDRLKSHRIAIVDTESKKVKFEVKR